MDAVAKTAPSPRTDSRGLVLDQAARMFRERGYAAASLRDMLLAMGGCPTALNATVATAARRRVRLFRGAC